MKKLFASMIVLLVLAGCSEETSNQEITDTTVEEEISQPIVQPETEELAPDEMYFESIGKAKIVGVGENIAPINMGPMELTINNLYVLDIETNGKGQNLYFDNQEKAKAILVDMKATNTSEQSINFYPNQAIVTTDSGEQIEETPYGLMGDIGGEFYGNVTKEGQTWWILNNLDKPISKVTLIVKPPHAINDSDYLSDENQIEFDISSWEEAKEKVEK